MRKGSSVLRPRRNTEALRRQVYLLVAALACTSQVALVGLDLMLGRGLHWESVFGAGLCGALILLLLFRTVSVQVVDFGVLLAASLGVAFELFVAFLSADAPPARLYFVGVFLFLAAFSILPAWYAALYTLLLFLVFVALTLLKGGDTTLLVELALIVLLIAHLSVFGQQVSAERTEARVFQELASTDVLTGLINRRAMYEALQQAFETAGDGPQPALLLLDIDHFKAVNDRYGHTVGDLVLQRFASVVAGAVRSQDVVSRWGGEEFLVLLGGIEESNVAELAQRLLAEVRGAAMPHELRVTASCGVAHASEVKSAADWLVQVDLRLYAAKSAGRDQVYPPAPSPIHLQTNKLDTA